jgi:hypothetical protein
LLLHTLYVCFFLLLKISLLASRDLIVHSITWLFGVSYDRCLSSFLNLWIYVSSNL